MVEMDAKTIATVIGAGIGAAIPSAYAVFKLILPMFREINGTPPKKGEDDNGSGQSMRLLQMETLAGVQDIRGRVQTLEKDVGGLREDVDKLKVAEERRSGTKMRAELGLADPFAHLIGADKDRKESA